MSKTRKLSSNSDFAIKYFGASTLENQRVSQKHRHCADLIAYTGTHNQFKTNE